MLFSVNVKKKSKTHKEQIGNRTIKADLWKEQNRAEQKAQLQWQLQQPKWVQKQTNQNQILMKKLKKQKPKNEEQQDNKRETTVPLVV